MNYSTVKLIYRIFILVILLTTVSIIVLNLDVVLRIGHAYQNGTLTVDKIRFELAAYDLGKSSPIKPIDQKKSTIDGMLQVYVPAGKFIMGAIHDHVLPDSPEHPVYLDAFWIDRVEVTNSMWLLCMKAKVCSSPVSDNHDYDQWIYRDHPIVYITWFQADQYCQWTGRRLPTEAEWEKAARGTDLRKYPWGNEPPTPRLANFSDALIGESVSAYRYPLGASPYGALNMAGNVREWIADWYDPRYYSYSPQVNPLGPRTGVERSLRSTSYNEDGHEIEITNRLRHEPQSAGLSRGFRCAQSANSGNQ